MISAVKSLNLGIQTGLVTRREEERYAEEVEDKLITAVVAQPQQHNVAPKRSK